MCLIKKSANFPPSQRPFYPQDSQYGDRVLSFLPAVCVVCFMVVACGSQHALSFQVEGGGRLNINGDIRHHVFVKLNGDDVLVHYSPHHQCTVYEACYAAYAAKTHNNTPRIEFCIPGVMRALRSCVSG